MKVTDWRLTNKQLTERIGELGALLGAVQDHFLDFRSGCNRDLDKVLERVTVLEDRPWNPSATCNGDTIESNRTDPHEICTMNPDVVARINQGCMERYFAEFAREVGECHLSPVDSAALRVALEGKGRLKAEDYTCGDCAKFPCRSCGDARFAHPECKVKDIDGFGICFELQEDINR